MSAIRGQGSRHVTNVRHMVACGRVLARVLAAVDAVTGALVDTWVADTTGSTPTVLTLAVWKPALRGRPFSGIDGRTKEKLAAIDTAR